MGATAKSIADQFIGAARENPSGREEIFKRAANTFMGLAMDPKNARSSQQLAKIGMDFATAASVERPATMSDFTDLLNTTRQAFEETGEDPMGAIARRAEIQAANTPVNPGQISIAPETFDEKSTLGRSAQITYQPTNDDIINGIVQRQTVAFWQGKKKEAQAMTVDVSLGFLPAVLQANDGTPFARQNNRPYAEIEFGSDGNRNLFQMDLGLGKRVTVVGNYVSVNIGMDPPFQPVAPPFNFTTKPITVGASIGAFAAPTAAPLIRTVYMDHLVANNGSAFLPIPLRAAQLLPIQSDLNPNLANQTIEFAIYDIGGNELSQFTYLAARNFQMSPIPIYGDAAYIAATLNNGPTTNVRLPFQLSL